jgi:mycothiol synthase
VPVPEPAWPAGVSTRRFEGRERDYADWLAIHNSSFAGHYLFSPATLEDCRRIAESPTAFAGGLLLAERGGACVGYCRLEQLQGHGEVAMVGVAPEARGLGLGRALLRWGVATLAARGLRPIRLTVDGLNESAVRLYRQERFEIEQTRDIWERAL